MREADTTVNRAKDDDLASVCVCVFVALDNAQILGRVQQLRDPRRKQKYTPSQYYTPSMFKFTLTDECVCVCLVWEV